MTSSLCYPQSNGEAEWAVQTVKNFLKKEGDRYLALLSYSVPLRTGTSYFRDIFVLFLQDYCALQELLM